MGRCLLVALGLTTLLVLWLSRAVTGGFAQLRDDVARVFGPGLPRLYGSEFHQPPHLMLDFTRTPDSWWHGGETVSSTLAVDPVMRPTALEIYSATDRDGDGHVAAFEWTLLCAAPITESRGESVAAIPPTHVGSKADAYLAVVRFSEEEPFWNGWCRGGLTHDDPW